MIAELKAKVSGLTIIDDPEVIPSYSQDQALFAKAGKAIAVVKPCTVQQVQDVMRFAYEKGITVVPRGAGSGLAGGANAIDGCIIISFEKMNAILEFDQVNQFARVESGVVNLEVDIHAAKYGLAYLPDPASREWSTIGGNIATNAGGMCCLKYGVTSNHVRALKVVLANGELIELGTQTKKQVSGLDLVRLFVGSEGTLGLLVEATLNLVIRPPAPTTFIFTFEDIESAAKSITSLLSFSPSMLEIIDKTTLTAIEKWQPIGFDVAGAAILMQIDLENVDAQRICNLTTELGAIDSVFTSIESETKDFLAVRKLAYPALERLGKSMLDDVVIPIDKISEFVSKVELLQSKYQLTIGIFGHAGDGNMHPTIVYPPNDLKAEKQAISAFNEIINLAQELGGTTSGEHGIGIIKLNQVKDEISEQVLRLQSQIKKVFDPNGLLNPGKKY